MDENNNVDIMSASEGDAGVVPPADRDISSERGPLMTDKGFL